MKIRHGFVSNSSSSSFVVVIKKDILKTLYGNGYDDALDELLAEDTVWEEEKGEEYDDLHTALEEYIVATLEVSSDAGQIVLADYDKVKSLVK